MWILQQSFEFIFKIYLLPRFMENRIMYTSCVATLPCELLIFENCCCCCCRAAVSQYYGDVSLALKVNTTLNAMWWMLNDTADHSPSDTHLLWMTSFNQRIAPSGLLSMATNYGYCIAFITVIVVVCNSLYYLILIHWSITLS